MPLSARSLEHWMKGEDSATVRFGKVFGVIAVSILLAPFFFLLLWKLIQNWGWWRVKREKGDRIYVKTWHGWVNEEKYLKNALKHGRLPGTRHCFGWKVTTAHLVHISWTPEGSKVEQTLNKGDRSLLRRLPYWSRIRKPINPGSGDSADVEMGIIPEPPSVHTRGHRVGGHRVFNQHGREPHSLEQVDGRFDDQLDGQFDGPSEPTPSSPSHVMSGALRHSSSEYNEPNTVRRRTIPSERSAAWQANSSETSRATVTQFLMPSHDFRTPVWANSLFGHETARGTVTSLQSDYPVLGSQPSQGASKRPLAVVNANGENAYNVGGRRAVRSSPTFSPPFTVSAASGLRLSTTLNPAAKLDKLSDYLGKDLRYVANAQTTAPSERVDLRVDRPALWPNSQSLTQRWKSRARPSITGIFSSIRRRSGQLGRRNNSSMRMSVEGSYTVTGDVLRAYENEESLDDAISYHTASEVSIGPVPRTLTEAIRESSSTVRPTSPAVYGFYYEDIRDYRNLSVANLSSQNLVIASHPSSGVPNDPYANSVPLRKRAPKSIITAPMDPATPRLAAHSTSPSSSRIPSMSLADAVTQASKDILKPRDAIADSAVSGELRERLPWLDLRCTMRMKGNALHSLNSRGAHQ